jgi:hypothetical protein
MSNKSIKKAAEVAEVELPVYQSLQDIPDDGKEWHIVDVRPIPPRSRETGESKYPVAHLAVGQSIVFRDQKGVRNAMVAARAYAKREADNGGETLKFATRKEGNLFSLIREK